ncbi:hypothetical protein E2542_SST04466 [Spatholobus suberectus]|nr:hypothetical protein E2542_SST04466 [Spatholobus suberectus]
MVKLLPCGLEVMGSNPGNSLSAFGGKAAYIYPPQTSLGGSLVYWVALFLFFLLCPLLFLGFPAFLLAVMLHSTQK